MQSRLGIASFVIGLAVGVTYVVIRVLLGSITDAILILQLNLWFLVGASVAGIVGLVLGILGWVRAQRSGRKTGAAILGSALTLAVTVWAAAVWIMSFTVTAQTPGI